MKRPKQHKIPKYMPLPDHISLVEGSDASLYSKAYNKQRVTIESNRKFQRQHKGKRRFFYYDDLQLLFT